MDKYTDAKEQAVTEQNEARHRERVAADGRKLLQSFAGANDCTLILFPGNIGDDLIIAGTRRLLQSSNVNVIDFRDITSSSGEVALVIGSGCWCRPWHLIPEWLAAIEQRFGRVVVLPSTYDTSEPVVRKALTATRALVFAREIESYRQIVGLCRADIALDGAFYFDYAPYRRPGSGTLYAYRTDIEAVGLEPPPGNNDISRTCGSLDEWLNIIADHEVIKTDRAHVMIAGALMGKRVFYRPSNYHKVPALAEFSLQGFPVVRDS